MQLCATASNQIWDATHTCQAGALQVNVGNAGARLSPCIKFQNLSQPNSTTLFLHVRSCQCSKHTIRLSPKIRNKLQWILTTSRLSERMMAIRRRQAKTPTTRLRTLRFTSNHHVRFYRTLKILSNEMLPSKSAQWLANFRGLQLIVASDLDAAPTHAIDMQSAMGGLSIAGV